MRWPGRRRPRIAETERLAVRPGDRIVLRCPRELDDAEIAELKANLAAAFKGADWKPPVLLLEGDMTIAVLGPDADGEPPKTGLQLQVEMTGGESLLKAMQAEVRKAGGDPGMFTRKAPG